MTNLPALWDRPAWIRYLLARDCYEFREEPFTLSSGKQSQHYIDCRKLTLHSRGSVLVAGEILNRIDGIKGKIWLGGPTIGADPIVGASICLADLVWSKEIHGFLTRKEAKAHGLGGQIVGRSPHWDAKVILVEDVLTTGASLISSIEALKTHKAMPEIVKAIVIVDRQEGGVAALKAEGVPVEAICTLDEVIRTWEEMRK